MVLFWKRKEAMQMVVCGMRRPVHLEGTEQSLGHTRQHGPPRSKSVSSTCCAQGVCDNLINALKFMANPQKDGDNPVKMVVQGFQEKSRLKVMVGLRRFIMVDNHVQVKVGDSEKNMKSRTVVKPKFTTDFLEAVVQQNKKVCCTPSLTPRMWETEDGDHRSWVETGTPSVRLFSKGSWARNGRP